MPYGFELVERGAGKLQYAWVTGAPRLTPRLALRGRRKAVPPPPGLGQDRCKLQGKGDREFLPAAGSGNHLWGNKACSSLWGGAKGEP